jgi:hypothetical protein
MAPSVALAEAAPRKSRRVLWISLGVSAALIVLTAGGGAFAFSQYIAPATAVGTFCGYLKAQDYTAAYGLFSAGLKSQYTPDQFTQGANTLDKVEGAVVSCGQAKSGNAYSYSLFSSTAQVKAVITRATSGELDGAIHLKSENGAWKVDALDTSLLGVNLGALQAAGAFCAALQGQDYATAYTLLGSASQASIKQADFLAQAHLHDQIDGSITACGLVAIASGASDTSASLTASITRGKLGEKQGNINLDVESNAWKIDTLADALLGSDLGPYQVDTRFCADLASGNYADAYAIVTQNFAGGQTEAQFAASLTLPAALNWGCKPDLSTYKVSGSSASYTVSVTVTDTATGQSAAQNLSFGFVQDNGVWKLDSTAKA